MSQLVAQDLLEPAATPSCELQLPNAPQLRVAPREEFGAAVIAMASGKRFAPLLESGWDRRAQQMSCLL